MSFIESIIKFLLKSIIQQCLGRTYDGEDEENEERQGGQKDEHAPAEGWEHKVSQNDFEGAAHCPGDLQEIRMKTEREHHENCFLL